MKSPSWARIVFLLLGLLILVFLLCRGPESISFGTAEALRILATVLSILAGFLIVAIPIIGDPFRLFGGSWRIASAHTRHITRSLIRLTALFYLYLIAILMAVVGTMLAENIPNTLSDWLRHSALSLGVVAIFWSFGLPVYIYRVLKERLEEETSKRLEEAKAQKSTA